MLARSLCWASRGGKSFIPGIDPFAAGPALLLPEGAAPAEGEGGLGGADFAERDGGGGDGRLGRAYSERCARDPLVAHEPAQSARHTTPIAATTSDATTRTARSVPQSPIVIDRRRARAGSSSIGGMSSSVGLSLERSGIARSLSVDAAPERVG